MDQRCGLLWIDVPERADGSDASQFSLVPVIEKSIGTDAAGFAADRFSPALPQKSIAENADESAAFPSKNAHIFIEGDNYPALKCLCKSRREKIDAIYIDPPYNTGSDFTYNDSRFLRRLPDGSFAGKNDPARHSAWLSFMSRRLALARELLNERGCIFISIGDEEYARLRLLCDAVFGEENYVNDFMYVDGKGKKDSWSRTITQHTLCFAKYKRSLPPFAATETADWATANADEDARGPWFSGSISFTESRSNPKHVNYFSITSPSGKTWTRQWLCGKDEMERLIRDGRIYWGKNGNGVPRKKIFNGEKSLVIPKNIVDCADSTRKAQRDLDDLLGVKQAFVNPKPVNLIEYLLEMPALPRDAVILDFFAGSATTLEAVLRLNKKHGFSFRCICIQSAEQAAGAEFDTIADIAYERIRRVMCGYTDARGKRNAALGGMLEYYRLFINV